MQETSNLLILQWSGQALLIIPFYFLYFPRFDTCSLADSGGKPPSQGSPARVPFICKLAKPAPAPQVSALGGSGTPKPDTEIACPPAPTEVVHTSPCSPCLAASPIAFPWKPQEEPLPTPCPLSLGCWPGPVCIPHVALRAVVCLPPPPLGNCNSSVRGQVSPDLLASPYVNNNEAYVLEQSCAHGVPCRRSGEEAGHCFLATPPCCATLRHYAVLRPRLVQQLFGSPAAWFVTDVSRTGDMQTVGNWQPLGMSCASTLSLMNCLQHHSAALSFPHLGEHCASFKEAVFNRICYVFSRGHLGVSHFQQ